MSDDGNPLVEALLRGGAVVDTKNRIVYNADLTDETFYGIQRFFIKADRSRVTEECGGDDTIAEWARENIPANGNHNGYFRKDYSDDTEISAYKIDEIREWLEDYVRDLPEGNYVEDYIPMAG